MDNAAPHSIHAIVTDPPYGVVEFDTDQLKKMKNGSGGVWRVPPSFDGHTRSPLPRFTALNEKERSRIYNFFRKLAEKSGRILQPGGHVFIANNAFIAPLVYRALEDGGLEFRGQTMRLVRTLRGGDRPKNAEEEFTNVCSLPRGCYEPWGIFRSKLPAGMRVQDSLRKFGTGGLRRLPNGNPFEDLIPSERTSQHERKLAGHPSLKPQSFLRKIVYASLPLGKGIILDPFMGSGSTLAAANACGLESIGIEVNSEYFDLAKKAVPKLSLLNDT
ncbi:DNA methylase [Candidatus Uhrbacteria bacterium RIFOXYB12_FULL_58_10]|nr:MAG: DNA methylase [Candidatus Uhrbacteria bacterium RIFOXYB12_FULL_58_10]